MKTTLTASALCACLGLGAARPASAYEVLTSTTCNFGRVFAGDVSFRLNLYDLPAAIDAWDYAYLVYELFERFDRTGGQRLDYQIWGSANEEPCPANGVSEVSFYGHFFTGEFGAYEGYTESEYPEHFLTDQPCSTDSDCSLGESCDGSGKCVDCSIVARDIYLRPDDSAVTWTTGVPGDEGEDYYRADDMTGTGLAYLRLAVIHEMGHVAGLLHVHDELGVMNENGTWTNRADEKKAELLGDDRAGVRSLYGDGTTETDVSVVNTWYDYQSGEYAQQYLQCAPSPGDGWGSSSWPYWIHPYLCGTTGGATGTYDPADLPAVCPGEDLYVRYTLNNNSTSSLSVTEELWFSENDWLNRTAGADKRSATTYTSSLLAGDAVRRARTFTVPMAVGYDRDVYVIAHAESGSDDAAESTESTQNNWIPLTGKVHIKSLADCLGPPLP